MLSFLLKKWEQMQAWLQANAVSSVKETLNKKGEIKLAHYRVLCIDDDQDFCTYIKKLARYQNILLDTAYSIKQAKARIEERGRDKQPFEAFIIDEALPDGSGFDLVAWIREKQGDVPIGFLSRIYQDVASFRLLKEKLKIEYVLEKPITPEKVDQLFKQLQLKTNRQNFSATGPSLEIFLSNVKQDYLHSIYSKVEQLEKLIVDVQRRPSKESVELLQNEIHNIAGSAGSYGFPAVSELCHSFEAKLSQQVKTFPLDPKCLADLDEFLSQIKLSFQIISEQNALSSTTTWMRPAVYIIKPDIKHLGQLRTATSNESFTVLIESNIEKAIHLLNYQDFDPQIILLDKDSIPSSQRHDLLESFYNKKSRLSVSKGLFINNLEGVLEDFICDIDYIFTESIESQSLLSNLKQIVQLQECPIILLLDQDSDNQYIYHALQEIGIEVQLLKENSSLEEALKTYRPELLIIDFSLILQKIESLKNLKADPFFQDFMIIMTTVTQEPEELKKIDEIHVDEVFLKPLDKNQLQVRILDLIKSHRMGLLSSEKNFSEIFTKSVLENYLNKKFITRFTSQNLASLVFFEISSFQQVKQVIDKKKENRILMEISYLLRQKVSRCELYAQIRDGVFAMVFHGFDLNFIALIMENFLENLKSEINQIIGLKEEIKFNCGIALLLKEYNNIEQIMRKAERALQLARQQPQGEIKIAILPEDQELLTKREVLIVGNPAFLSELIDDLKQASFNIVKVNNSAEALAYLLDQPNQILIPLLIVEQNLSDKNGLDILSGLKKQKGIRFPVLNFLASEQKVEGRFSRGYLNYIKKPFNCMILVYN
jgi:DNA-binding response OmpR family regulator